MMSRPGFPNGWEQVAPPLEQCRRIEPWSEKKSQPVGRTGWLVEEEKLFIWGCLETKARVMPKLSVVIPFGY
jgi:hypothetical protein